MSPQPKTLKGGLVGKDIDAQTRAARVEVFSRVASGELKLVDAAEILGLSYRQVKRIWQRYQAEGAAGLQHRSAGRESNRAKGQEFRDQLLHVVREK